MTIYIPKDAHEKLDYVFARYLQEDITSVTYYQEAGSTINIESCQINPAEMSDEEGNTFPPNRVILLWVSGGEVGTSSKVRVEYTTSGGRILDFEVVFMIVDNY